MTDLSRPTRARYIVLFGLCFAAALAYLDRLALGCAKTTISADTGVSLEQMGLAFSVFFFTYALFQIPTGCLIDRWGARRSLFLFGMLGACTVALSAGTLILGAYAAFWVLFLSRALMGIAQAGLFPASTRCIASWFPVEQRANASGILLACMSLGLVVGGPTLYHLLEKLAWPWLFLIIAVPGFIWSVWFFIWFRDRPEDHASANEAERAKIAAGRSPISATPVAPMSVWRLATNRKLIWLCSSQFFRAGANVFWMTWFPSYLETVYRLSREEAGWLIMYPPLGVVLGSLLGGWLADQVLIRTGSKRWSRQGVAIGFSAVGVVLFLAAYGIPMSVHGAVALLFAAAVFSSAPSPCTYGVSIDIGGRRLAVVFGAMNMMGNIGAALFPLIAVQWMLAYPGPALMLLMALLYFLGMVCWCFVDPNGTIDE